MQYKRTPLARHDQLYQAGLSKSYLGPARDSLKSQWGTRGKQDSSSKENY
jgi:hypothetical protein